MHIINESYTKLFLFCNKLKKTQQSINSRQVHGVSKKRCQTVYIVSLIKDSFNILFLFVSQKKKIQQSMNLWHLKGINNIFDHLHCFLLIFNEVLQYFEVLQYLNVKETCEKDGHCFHKDC